MQRAKPTLWFTGLSSAGKSTLSQAVQSRLCAMGHRAEILDGDAFRLASSKDLGFSKQDREENVRRLGEAAKALSEDGVITLVAAISPYRSSREQLRSRLNPFIEIFVNAPLAVCESRDVKGLYQKARAGKILRFTGIDDPYEPPVNPEIECRTDLSSVEECVDKIVNYVAKLSANLSAARR